MKILEAILTLLAGCGVFLAGMNMLGDGLERSAGGGLKRLFEKISGNRFAGVGVGAGATAIIQSSSATSVMVVGFVNAGIMSLMQATPILMGAKIGTTITGVIVAFSSLKIVKIVIAAMAFVGVMMCFIKNERVKQIGTILCGFGLIFVGLDVMSMGFDPDKYPELTAIFLKLFETIDFPLLLVVCGIAFTALIQSSSAATGIFIMMVGTGTLGLENALFLALGANIGTCVTALIASIGASVNARRTAFIHLIISVFGVSIFLAPIWIFKSQIVTAFEWCLPGNTQMQLAWFYVIFNCCVVALFLPFVKQIVKLSETVIKDKQTGVNERQFKYVDERFLKTPSVALMQVKKEIEYMGALAEKNLKLSFNAMDENAVSYKAEIIENEAVIDFTNKALTKYLIKLSSLVDTHDERKIGSYFHVLNDLERVGDHAENFFEIAMQMQDGELCFSDNAKRELKDMQTAVLDMFAIARTAFDETDSRQLAELTALENTVDGMKRDLTARHYARLAEGNCKVELSPYFSSTVAGLERVADHLVNVGFSILNPTGSQSEARETGAIPAEA